MIRGGRERKGQNILVLESTNQFYNCVDTPECIYDDLAGYVPFNIN